MRISDWSSDVCSSDLAIGPTVERDAGKRALAPCLDSHGKPAIGHVAAKLFRRPLHGPEDARLPQHAKQRMLGPVADHPFRPGDQERRVATAVLLHPCFHDRVHRISSIGRGWVAVPRTTRDGPWEVLWV